MAGPPGAPGGVFTPNPHPMMGGDTVPSESELPPNHPAARRPPPHNYADRMVGLSKAHPWMPPQTASALAMTPGTDTALLDMSRELRKAYGSIDNAVHYTTEDPLLQKDPSLGLSIRSYLTNTQGPQPLAQSDLSHMQQQLQKQGFGQGLSTDGVWDNGWNTAYGQYITNWKAKALGGDQPGSTPLGHVLNFFNAMLPRQAATAVAGWATGLPSSLHQDLRTAAGAVGAGASNVAFQLQPKQLFNLNPNQIKEQTPQQESGLAAKAENLVPGQRTTPQTSFPMESFREQAANIVQAAGDAFLISGVGGAAGQIGRAAGENGLLRVGSALSKAEAERGPGAIAKTFYNPMEAGSPGGLLSKAAATNQPILRLAGPVVSKTFAKDGYYYAARSLLATPYRVGAVRTAGTAIGQLGYQGLKTQAVADLTTGVGGQQSALQQSINKMQTINQFDDALQAKLGFTILGHHVAPGLNTLAWMLHPPMEGTNQLSASVGRDITGANNAIINAFGDSTGFGVQIERGTGQSMQNLIKQAGGERNFSEFWASKVFQHASVHHAEVLWNGMSQQDQMEAIDRFSSKADALDAYASQVRTEAVGGNPESLVRAVGEMLTNDHPDALGEYGGTNELGKRIMAEIVRSGDSPRAWLQKNVSTYAEAARLFRDVIVPRQQELIADESKGVIGMARSDYTTSQDGTATATALEDRYQSLLDEAQQAAQGKSATARPTRGPAESALAEYMRTTDRDDIDVEKMRALSRATRDEKNVTAPTPPKSDFQKRYDTVMHEVRQELADKYGVDPGQMPKEDRELIDLLKTRADRQAAELFMRDRPLRLKPDDPAVGLRNPLEGPAQLSQHVPGSLYSNQSPGEALNTLLETGDSRTVGKWSNDRAQLHTNRGITIEHDPAGLHGEHDRNAPGASYQHLRNRATFNAARMNSEGLDNVRSVEIRPVRGESQAAQTARRLLTDKLQDNHYIPFDQGSGTVRWVREDLTGGTIPTSPQMRDAYARLAELGYKPVIGNGIGFDFYNHPALDVFDTHLTRAKRIMESLGLSSENIPSADVTFWNKMEIQRGLQKSIAAGRIKLPPYYSAHTIMADLIDKDLFKAKPGIATTLTHVWPMKRAHDANLAAITEHLMSSKNMSHPLAEKTAEANLSQELENPLGLMHVSPGDVKKILMRKITQNEDRPQESQLEKELEFRHHDGTKVSANPTPLSRIYKDQPLFDEKSSQEVYRVIQRAKANVPARLLGWQNLENVAALGLSYAGRPIPGSAGRVIENLPTRLVSLRNKFRFTLSPEFQLRRVVKVNAKMALDDIPPTMQPMHALKAMGVYKEAMNNLDRIMPEYANPSLDEGTQAFYAADPWGIYNHRNFEAYGAWHWKQMGKTDSEIRANLIKDFGYGSKAYGEGRSSLERSVNFVFFPFSFDKTLYRNFGAYMMDHTAQRLLLQRGLEAYNNYNIADPNGDKFMSSAWAQKHLPVAQEALRLNAFAHGVGLGEFGGINAPLLNLFIPQAYNVNPSFLKRMAGFVPAITEFQDFYNEVTQQGRIAYTLTMDQLHPAKQGVFFARPVAETSTAQLSDAYAYRRQISAAWSKYVEYNAHHKVKYQLPNDQAKFGQWAGATLNATLIDNLVHQKYPAFQVIDPELYYVKAAAAINSYSHQMQVQGQNSVVSWIADAQKIGTAVYRSKVNSTQASAYTKILRQYAIRFAETIPGFLTFYNSNFRWQYGPLEAVR